MRWVLAHTIVNDKLKTSWGLGDGFKENVLKMEILCSDEIFGNFRGDIYIFICPNFMDEHRQINQNSSLNSSLLIKQLIQLVKML